MYFNASSLLIIAWFLMVSWSRSGGGGVFLGFGMVVWLGFMGGVWCDVRLLLVFAWFESFCCLA